MHHVPKDHFFTSLFIYILFSLFLLIWERLGLLDKRFYVSWQVAQHLFFFLNHQSSKLHSSWEVNKSLIFPIQGIWQSLICILHVYICKAFCLLHKHTQKISITLFSKVFVTYKAVRVKQVTLYAHWFFKNVFSWNFKFLLKGFHFLTVTQT